MDKQQDADIEKGREDIQLFLEDEHPTPFEYDDGDLFEEHVSEESEFDYEPDGAFLD